MEYELASLPSMSAESMERYQRIVQHLLDNDGLVGLDRYRVQPSDGFFALVDNPHKWQDYAKELTSPYSLN